MEKKQMNLSLGNYINVDELVEKLDFAFQPIVNIKTGRVLGYEALLRNYDRFGFKSVFELFDFSYKNGILYEIDIELRKKVINKYKEAFKKGLLLFYNLDTRILEDRNYKKCFTKKYLETLELDSYLFVFEISERFRIENSDALEIVENYSKQGFRVALDDFGVGNICLESIYRLKPDILKLDGFFVDGVNSDVRKKVLIEAIVKLANSLGFTIISEKVETLEHIYELDSIGINLVQGCYIQKPMFRENFDTEFTLDLDLKRGKSYREDLLKRSLKVKPLRHNDKTIVLFDYIKYSDHQYIPITNNLNFPIHVINTKKILKNIANSKYFLDLYIKDNKKIEEMESFLEKPAILEVTDTINLEKLTNLLVSDRDIIILTENYRYVGVLTYKSLLEIVHKNKLFEAVNTNPLTGLPGNLKIKDYIEENLSKHVDFAIVYFDFDNFKPFNDNYGFRVGDRVIQLFSNILSSNLMNKDYFIGHIGGDDFFAGKAYKNFEDILLDIEHVVELFKRQVISFYNKEDVQRGYILGKDRDGNEKKFGILSVSAGILLISKSNKKNIPFIDQVISDLKSSVKSSVSKISIATLI
ncbi:MAG: GGDEF domain-containing protein [Hydrogenothermaceae bacterium]|nr:GGDEF domain-containing protein [Hydrogenothermaceae bacterium]